MHRMRYHLDRALHHVAQQIGPLDQQAMDAARQRQNQLAKPPGSLGRLERLSLQLAGITGQARPRLEHKAVVVMAGDHGVVAEGVSAYPAAVTPQMVRNFARGRSDQRPGPACRRARPGGGCRHWRRSAAGPADRASQVAWGTAHLAAGPAMTQEQALAALTVGLDVVAQEVARTGRHLPAGDGDW